MGKRNYYSITTRKFVLYSRRQDWLLKTQDLYNDIVLFYYRLFLERGEINELRDSRQICRELEKLTIVGREKVPVSCPLPWKKVPLYFRRAAVNAAVSAGKSFLSREEQKTPSNQFDNSVTYYKGMYRNFCEKEIQLKVWNGQEWRWISCGLRGCRLTEKEEALSPCVVLRGKRSFLNLPVKSPVSDGRKAAERMQGEVRLCSVRFTNEDAVAVCVVMDGDGVQRAARFLKGGRQYEHQCSEVLRRIERSEASSGKQKQNQLNKKYWIKLKNISDYYSNCLSRQIIEFAVEENAGMILLPGYDRNFAAIMMNRAGNWSALRLSCRIREQLSYKAWREGILVLDADVRNVSSKCFQCGAPVRKNKQQFCCENGHEGNRHLNAALNMGKKCISGFRCQSGGETV